MSIARHRTPEACYVYSKYGIQTGHSRANTAFTPEACYVYSKYGIQTHSRGMSIANGIQTRTPEACYVYSKYGILALQRRAMSIANTALNSRTPEACYVYSKYDIQTLALQRRAMSIANTAFKLSHSRGVLCL